MKKLFCFICEKYKNPGGIPKYTFYFQYPHGRLKITVEPDNGFVCEECANKINTNIIKTKAVWQKNLKETKNVL